VIQFLAAEGCRAVENRRHVCDNYDGGMCVEDNGGGLAPYISNVHVANNRHAKNGHKLTLSLILRTLLRQECCVQEQILGHPFPVTRIKYEHQHCSGSWLSQYVSFGSPHTYTHNTHTHMEHCISI
jgi:hypothetical protein